jgi:hypothetical protein
MTFRDELAHHLTFSEMPFIPLPIKETLTQEEIDIFTNTDLIELVV